MKTRKMIRWSTPTLAAIGLIGAGLILAQAQPPKTKTDSKPLATNSVAVKTEVAATTTKAQETKKPGKSVSDKPAPLTGAELYSINCNRCHQERYPTERTGAQWKTIMLHMQVRANLPPKDAKLILQFLQENSGR